ncbi:MAG TPA: Asp-tRNA(Asn)/Glu-tRNA(Gln) amidotransferase subunit GatA [Ruminococcaceae bacterium]|nr:Asp-tRNA(Asn)/Glu-tRNA(Gln) amidotransferase subunit GatA [Oscillospiraceae bacterium]
MNNLELRKLSLAEAQALIFNKKLSPVDLLEAYLERIEQTEETLNAFVEVYADSARREAKAMEEMQMANHFIGPLHGIPIALKDNIALKDLRTTVGSRVYSENFSEQDAPVAAKLKSAGAVIVGKTLMHEFAWGATTDTPAYGASHNPWDTKRFCAGSSGGSAASVASGTSIAALGTDTGGSVRLPASICGLVGMRPTIGRVSVEGITPLSYTLDSCGPLTRDVRDNAIMLGAMAGYVPTDPSSAKLPTMDFTEDLDMGAGRLRIGILPEVLFQTDQPDVVKSVKDALDIYRELGAEIVECRMDNLDLMQKAWYAVCSMEASTIHQKHSRERQMDYGEDVRTLLLAGELLPGTAYLQAQKYRRWLRGQFETAFKNVDMFLFPTLPATAVPIGEYDLIINGKEENMLPLTCTYVCYAPVTGLPALSVPCGLDHEGLPIGMQLLGKAFAESTLYRAAAAFETKFTLKDKLPLV